MAIIYIDGFNYSLDTLESRYTIDGTPNIEFPGYHGGNLIIPGGPIDASNITKTGLPPNEIITVGFAFKYTGTPSNDKAIIQLRAGGTAQVTLRLRPNRKDIGIYQAVHTRLGVSNETLTEDEWHYIEWYTAIDPVFGESQLRVDGAVWLTVSGVDTQGDPTDNYVDGFTIGEKNDGQSGTFQYDDFYFSHGLDYIGPNVEIHNIYPIADTGFNSWSSTTSPHYLAVDEFGQDDDASFVSTETEGQTELYGFTDFATDGAIKAVQMVGIGKRGAAPAPTHKLAYYVELGSFYFINISSNLLPTYKASHAISTTIPNSGDPWIPFYLNDATFGFQLAPISGPLPPIN